MRKTTCMRLKRSNLGCNVQLSHIYSSRSFFCILIIFSHANLLGKILSLLYVSKTFKIPYFPSMWTISDTQPFFPLFVSKEQGLFKTHSETKDRNSICKVGKIQLTFCNLFRNRLCTWPLYVLLYQSESKYVYPAYI